MRKISVTVALALCALLVWAVPAKPGFRTVTLADGSTVEVEMRGDEWSHHYVTRDGQAVELTADGRLVPVVPRKNASSRRQAPPRMVGSTQVPTSGSPRVPVLVVEFSDKKASNPLEAFRTQYTSGDKSAYQYFCDQSNGLYRPQFDVFGIYSLSNPRATYGGNDSDGNDVGVGLMVAEAIELAAAAGVDFSPYDNDGDHNVDVVVVVYAGVGEAQAYNTVPNSVWPCQWSLSEAKSWNDGPGAITKNGVRLNKFAVFNEVYGSNDNNTRMDGVGTFCHEFSHCLGLPDFYETSYNHGYFGMDEWSLMDEGCYNDNGYTPVGYSAYEKHFMGWIDFITPEPNTCYTLPVWNQKNAATDQAVCMVSPVNPNEWFIIENRARQGWDAAMSSQGLLVTHISYLRSRWEANTPNNQNVQLATILPADNKLTALTTAGDLWPLDDQDSLTDNSAPATVLYLTAQNVATGSAGYLGQPVTEMTRNADGTISFWYMKNDNPPAAPTLLAADAVTDSSFRATWTAVPAAQSYTLQVTLTDTAVTKLQDVMFPNATWAASAQGTVDESAVGCLRLGTATANGSVTSPDLTLGAGRSQVSVTVTAKSYGGDTEVPMLVSVHDAQSTVLDSAVFTLTNSDAQYSALLRGTATGVNRVRIANTTLRKRVMLQAAQVWAGDAYRPAAPLAVAPAGDALQHVITGITDTTCTVTGLLAGQVYDYMVKAVTARGIESEWSNRETVVLWGGPQALAGDVNGDGRVTIADVNAVINIILNGTDATDATTVARADVNRDGQVTIADANAVIAAILGTNQ